MTSPDVFALKNSGLENFLFAEIGLETNGSSLTILSLLARLGMDPWARAAEWAAAPRSKVVDLLAAEIGRMPLGPDATATAHATAARLASLLPSAAPLGQTGADGPLKPMQMAVMILIAFGLVTSLALSVAAQFRQPATPAASAGTPASAGLSEAAAAPR